jgi:hypothetical protein
MKRIRPHARHRSFRSGSSFRGGKWTRRAAAVAAAVMLVWIAGCGGPSGGKGRDAKPGETIYVEGNVSLRGSRPFPLLLLEAKDGAVYMIDTSPKAEELKNLDGMAVGVTAKVLPGVKGDAPALSVFSYNLLPLPGGQQPIVGVVYARLDMGDVRAAMEADDGSVWIIEGMFESVFLDLKGARVWIVGDRQWTNNTKEGTFRMINVSEYGVIRPYRKDGIEIPAP